MVQFSTEAAVFASAGRIETIADAATAPPINSWRREDTAEAGVAD